MDEFLIGLYLRQLVEECRGGIEAAGLLNQAVRGGDIALSFQCADSIVYHAAAVSRFLWSPGSRDKALRRRSESRGAILRSSLAIPADHPIKSRTLRDHLEHFDERLDEWAE